MKKKYKTDYMRIVLVVAVVVLGLSVYFFYQDNLQKGEIISNQTSEIGELDLEIQNQNSTIEGLNVKIIGLEGNISASTADLENKTKTLLLLEETARKENIELSSKKKEAAELTPIVKEYYTVGLKGQEGIIVPMSVKVTGGTGLLSVNIKKIDLQSGATSSIRLASQIAAIKAGVDLKKKDIEITFSTQESGIVALDGTNSGAAITVAIYAALKSKDLDTDSMITGTIEINEKIGRVDGVGAKAQAAKNYGKTKFYVPDGESVSVSGLKVVEVSNIDEAISHIVK